MLYKAITKITKLLCNSDAGNDNNNNNNQLLTQHMSVKLNWRIAVAEMIIFTYCWLVKKKKFNKVTTNFEQLSEQFLLNYMKPANTVKLLLFITSTKARHTS